MALIDEIESDAILGLVILGVIYYLGKKLISGVTAGVTYVGQAASDVAQTYVGTFYTPTNDYGGNTVVTHSTDTTPGAQQKQPDINTDPFIWGTSF